MQQLIPIQEDGERKAVNARDLYLFLEVGKDFSTWIKNRITKYNFLENEDYVICKSIPQNGGTVIDYHISIDMAKELSMVERNDKGKEARQYFIECEKVAKDPVKHFATMSNYQTLLLAAEMAKKIEEKEELLRLQAPKVLFADALVTSKSSMLVGELAKLIKQNGVSIGQNRLFDWLRSNGYLIRQMGESYNLPTQRGMELGLFEIKKRAINNADGTIRTTTTTKVTGKGQSYFVNKFLSNKEDN